MNYNYIIYYIERIRVIQTMVKYFYNRLNIICPFSDKMLLNQSQGKTNFPS